MTLATGTDSSESIGDFAPFFHEHRDRLHRFLWRLIRDAAITDELLQKTFVVAWERRASVSACDAQAAWLRRTAFRLWRDRQTESGDCATVADAPAGLESVPTLRGSGLPLAHRIAKVVDDLPEEQRVVFVLFRYESLTCAQIGEAIDVPVELVAARLGRAIALLGAEVRKHRELDPPFRT